MSSQRKDARWRLAIKMAHAANIEWNSMSFTDVQNLLQIAEHELERNPGRIEPLAREWSEMNE